MAGSKTNYLENKILDLVLGGQALTPPGTVYIALSNAAYSEAATGASMTEVSTSGTSYARVALANDLTSWPAATGGQKSNGVPIAFPTATGAWGTALSFYVCDAATGGNALYGGDLATSRTVATGDTPSFAVGALVVTED